MSDISRCRGGVCSVKEHCLRFASRHSGFMPSVAVSGPACSYCIVKGKESAKAAKKGGE